MAGLAARPGRHAALGRPALGSVRSDARWPPGRILAPMVSATRRSDGLRAPHIHAAREQRPGLPSWDTWVSDPGEERGVDVGREANPWRAGPRTEAEVWWTALHAEEEGLWSRLGRSTEEAWVAAGSPTKGAWIADGDPAVGGWAACSDPAGGEAIDRRGSVATRGLMDGPTHGGFHRSWSHDSPGRVSRFRESSRWSRSSFGSSSYASASFFVVVGENAGGAASQTLATSHQAGSGTLFAALPRALALAAAATYLAGCAALLHERSVYRPGPRQLALAATWPLLAASSGGLRAELARTLSGALLGALRWLRSLVVGVTVGLGLLDPRRRWSGTGSQLNNESDSKQGASESCDVSDATSSTRSADGSFGPTVW